MMFVLPETLCGASSEAGSWESRLRYREMLSGARALFAAGALLQLYSIRDLTDLPLPFLDSTTGTFT